MHYGPIKADILTENNSLLETYILKYEQGLNHRWMTIADSTLSRSKGFSFTITLRQKPKEVTRMLSLCIII